jgi:hypothetical protein
VLRRRKRDKSKPEEPWPDYQWAESSDAPDAVGLTFVSGVDRNEVAKRLECDPSSRHIADFGAAEGEQDHTRDRLVVQLDEVGDWIVVVEPNGYLGSVPEILADLSQGGRALSVFWNVNALMRVCYAEGGQLRRQRKSSCPVRQPSLVEGPEVPRSDAELDAALRGRLHVDDDKGDLTRRRSPAVPRTVVAGD